MNSSSRRDEEADAAMAKQQLRVRELERKATFEATQTEMRRQKDTIQSLRRENDEIRGALVQSSKGQTQNTDNFGRKEVKGIQQKTFGIRRTYDDLRAANDTKVREIEKMAEQLEELRREADPIISDTSPMAQKIRTLENSLDKHLIKHNEAMSIRRTYEGIVKRLREERVSFDNQLGAIEKTLKAKEHDYTELLNMAHDAQHAKEIAKAEVQQFKLSYNEERREKKKLLEERKAYVNTLLNRTMQAEKAAKQKAQKDERESQAKQEEEERKKRETLTATTELRTEEEAERLQQYATAYRKIKESTRASNVDEVIAKFITQEDTHRSLVDLTRDIQAKIDTLHQRRAELQRKVEDAKYSGSGHLGSRRIVDEFEAHLAEARAQLDKSSSSFEKISHIFVDVRSGVEHLSSKLSSYHPEKIAPEIKTDESLVEVLKHCEQKLQQLVDEGVSNGESLDDLLANTTVELPQYNLRVKAQGDGDDKDDEAAGRAGHRDGHHRGGQDAEDAEDDPHDRVALKHMSLSAVERETKKQRKRGRKKDGEDA